MAFTAFSGRHGRIFHFGLLPDIAVYGSYAFRRTPPPTTTAPHHRVLTYNNSSILIRCLPLSMDYWIIPLPILKLPGLRALLNIVGWHCERMGGELEEDGGRLSARWDASPPARPSTARPGWYAFSADSCTTHTPHTHAHFTHTTHTYTRADMLRAVWASGLRTLFGVHHHLGGRFLSTNIHTWAQRGAVAPRTVRGRAADTTARLRYARFHHALRGSSSTLLLRVD